MQQQIPSYEVMNQELKQEINSHKLVIDRKCFIKEPWERVLLKGRKKSASKEIRGIFKSFKTLKRYEKNHS